MSNDIEWLKANAERMFVLLLKAEMFLSYHDHDYENPVYDEITLMLHDAYVDADIDIIGLREGSTLAQLKAIQD